MNKAEYKKNREAGLRGQGKEFDPVTVVKVSNPSHWIGTKKVNRKTARRKNILRTFTKKGYMFGVQIGSKEFNIRQHLLRQVKKSNDMHKELGNVGK